MNAWKVIFATLVIFGAGLALGVLVSHNNPAGDSPSVTRQAGGQNFNGPQRSLRDLLHRMDRELGLTAGQHEHIEKIIAASQDHTQKLMKPVTLEVGRETTKACEEIRDALTPEQQKKFDTFSKTRRERGERGGRGRPPTNSIPDDHG